MSHTKWEHLRQLTDLWSALSGGSERIQHGVDDVEFFLEKLGYHEVAEAMQIAWSRPCRGKGGRFRYFGGVCWNKLNPKTEEVGLRSNQNLATEVWDILRQLAQSHDGRHELLLIKSGLVEYFENYPIEEAENAK